MGVVEADRSGEAKVTCIGRAVEGIHTILVNMIIGHYCNNSSVWCEVKAAVIGMLLYVAVYGALYLPLHCL